VATDREQSADDARIAALARELASAINASESSGRVGQRDLAIDVLRDAVETGPGSEEEQPKPRDPTAPVNPFALGIPLLMAGVALSFIFPPVGVLLLGVGLLVCLLGLVLAIARSLLARRRGDDGPGLSGLP
jgi:hypothetical protein